MDLHESADALEERRWRCLLKLIVQIPCYNEAETIGVTLKALPRQVDGFDEVEWLIIDDGCVDDTVKIAKSHGVDHVVSFIRNRGLAKGFIAGLDACVKLGADVIVNTDADNQYSAEDIAVIARPVLAGDADMVIGARPIDAIEHFSPVKKMLQKFGSRVVRLVSGINVPDAPSGFRAISRDAAMRLNVFNEHTYTLETIIQAGQKNMAVKSEPIHVNGYLRPSRLIKSIPQYIKRATDTLVRIFVVYKPFRFFFTIGVISLALGVLIGARFVYYVYIVQDGTSRVQSLILASILLGFGFQTILVAFLADLMSVNRKLLEDVQYRLKKIELDAGDK